MPISLKNDDSFLRKLIVGAEGTKLTINELVRLGFSPIELERGSTSFKLWKKIKIKRVRVPDILCLKSGARIESRGKTKLEVSMSHSLRDHKRAWDYGMRDNDYVSIVLLDQNNDNPIDIKQVSPIHFICLGDMRKAFSDGSIKITKPKGIEEGSEIRAIWPTAVANVDSVVEFIDDSTIRLSPLTGGRAQRVQLNRNNGIKLLPQVKIGENVVKNRIVASVIPVYIDIYPPANVDESFYSKMLTSMILSERYAAAKALRYIGFTDETKEILLNRMSDQSEDIYVQLEAAAALATYGDQRGWQYFEEKLWGSALTNALETQLETLIVVSEIKDTRSEEILSKIMRDTNRDEELRAGAAWGLGQFSSANSANALIDMFNSNHMDIRTEAARALLRISDSQIPLLIEAIMQPDQSKRDGIAWVLARSNRFDPLEITETTDENLARWVSYILGYGKPNFSEESLRQVMDKSPRIYFAASVLWQILSSWINDLKEY